MEKVVVSIHNGLVAEAITKILTDSGEYMPIRVPVGGRVDLVAECRKHCPDMIISEVAFSWGTSVAVRLKEAKQIRETMPDCKIVFLCDENSVPDMARSVMLAKKDGLIDAFFYSSVTAKYILAAIQSL